jgi:transketolase
MDIKLLEEKSKAVRLECIEMAFSAGKGHMGGTLSCVDMLVSLYYGGIMDLNPFDPFRDRFILSKGHACLALYSILNDLGILSKEALKTYGENGGLGGQLDISIPGVDWNTGSLGHSLGVCAGMAMASKLEKDNSFHACTLVGDAECAEGSIWESLMFITEHKLGNVTLMIDRNRLSVTEVLDDDSFFKNLPSIVNNFGWECFEINGHSHKEILEAMVYSKKTKNPLVIVANTIKGKGISFMENNVKWHQGIPSEEQMKIARKELKDG